MLVRLKSPIHEQREAKFRPGSWSEEERTIDVVWSTGARGLRRSWYRGSYYESLSMDAEHVRLDRLNRGAPLLSAHNSYDNRAVIGVVVEGSARIVDGQGVAKVRLSEAESAADDVFKILEGTLRNVSVGYDVYSYEITERDEAPDEYRAVDWEPYEVSIVPMPFDMDAQVRHLRALNPEVPALAPEPTDDPPQERNIMPDPNENQADVIEIRKQAAAEAAKAERARIRGIRTAAGKLGLDASDDKVMSLIDSGVELGQARAQLIDMHAEHIERSVPEQSPQITGGAVDELDHKVRGIQDALLWRSKPEKFDLTEAGRDYRYVKLIDVARMASEAAGVRTAGKSDLEIVRSALKARNAFATTDFADLMTSTSRRILRKAYTEAPANYQLFCERRTSPDFKSTKELIFGGMGVPVVMPEGGEFKHVSETLAGKEWSLSTYGHKMNLTLQAILGDDLSAFSRASAQFGAAARRLENKLFFDLLMSNPTVYDGSSMFLTSRGNVLRSTTTPAAADPSKTQYSAMRKILGKQQGLDSNEDLELEGRYILSSMHQLTAAEAMTVQLTPETNGNAVPNALRGYMPVPSARIDRTDEDVYFLATDKSQHCSFIYAHLNGMENGPAVEQKDSWDTLGVEWRSYTFFAVSAIDWRGWVLNDQNDTFTVA